MQNRVTVGKMQMYSHALESMVTYTILLPDPEVVGPGPYPVLLQLHGYYDDQTAWLYKSNLLLHIERLPLIVVLPDGGNYFWCDYGPKARIEKFVAFDLWNHVRQTFPARKDSKWAIGGLSMGGFGALRLGLKFPNKYGSVYAHSSVIPTQAELSEWEPPFPPTVHNDMDCYRLAERIDPAKLPRLSFDCGVDDTLIMDNRRFHDHLTKLSLPHHYAEYPGAHTWDYWNTHVQTALRQHAEVFNIAPVPEG